MNGILYGEFFFKLMFVSFAFYSVIYAISLVLLDQGVDEKPTEKKSDEKNTGKDVITLLVIFAVILFMVFGGLYWILNQQNVFGAGLILLLSVLYCGIAFGSAAFDFVKYIFLKSSDFKLTKEHESSLWIIGFSTCTICYAIEIAEFGKSIDQSIFSLVNYQADIVKVIVLILWYFSIIFFTISFFLLSLHKAIIIIKRFIKPSHKKEISQSQKKREKEWRHISEGIWRKTEKLPTKQWKRWFYYLLWLFCLVIETILVFASAFVKLLKDLIWVVVIGLPKLLWRQVKKWLELLEKDQGKGIIISSRISLVASLLIVFFIDKYQGIFSAEGSGVYEFMCSVILIPFLITQLGALREKRG